MDHSRRWPLREERRLTQELTRAQAAEYGTAIRSIIEQLVSPVCNPIVHPAMDRCGGGEDVDYCLDFSDIVGDEATEEEHSVGPIDFDDREQDDHEILRLGLSYCKPEIPEFCVMDGFNLYKGCKEELPQEGKHVESLLRLNYDDVLSSWCDDRSLWTDGKRPQTVPEAFAFADQGPRVNDFGLVPELGTCSQANSSTFGDREDESRGARVTRYREKKRSRLFSKKIRYEVRKVNAERRPRMKGRFVKRTSKLTAQR